MADSTPQRDKLKAFWAARATEPLHWREFDQFCTELHELFDVDHASLMRMSEVVHFSLLPQYKVRPVAAYWSLACWSEFEQPLSAAKMAACAEAGRAHILGYFRSPSASTDESATEDDCSL